MDDVTALTTVICAAALSSAAYSDAVSREVGDLHWALIAALPLLGIAAGMRDLPSWMSQVCCFGCAASGSRRTAAVLASASVAAWAAAFWSGADLYDLAAAPMVVLFRLGYDTGVLRGGADAKALMALTVVFPAPFTYLPDPWRYLPPQAVFLTAGILFSVIGGGVWLIIRAVRLGCISSLPRLRLPIDAAERAFVWPAERVEGGCIVRSPIRDQESAADVYADLREAGAETVLVDPMIPFMVPLAAGFAATVLFGMRS